MINWDKFGFAILFFSFHECVMIVAVLIYKMDINYKYLVHLFTSFPKRLIGHKSITLNEINRNTSDSFVSDVDGRWNSREAIILIVSLLSINQIIGPQTLRIRLILLESTLHEHVKNMKINLKQIAKVLSLSNIINVKYCICYLFVMICIKNANNDLIIKTIYV